mgnify:CR=1 FL=1
MAKQILYGVGKAALRDYANPKKLIAMSDMQDLSIESTYSAEDITGGNKMFPIASFPKDKALNISATNATFNWNMLEYLEGSEIKTENVVMADMMEVKIPANGVVTLEHTPIENSVLVMGFEAGEEPAANVFKVEDKTVTFVANDAGKLANIFYQYNGSEKAISYGVTQKTMAKPFIFDYTFPVHDEDTQITHYATLSVYKAKCTSGFSLDAAHQTAVTQKFEASAQDAQRLDGHLWDLAIDGVVVTA